MDSKLVDNLETGVFSLPEYLKSLRKGVQHEMRINKSRQRFLLEVCVDSFESAVAAILGGADRLEVCSALAVGGLTPNISLMQKISNYKLNNKFSVSLAAMIRPRSGDFIYSEEELSFMMDEIDHLINVCDTFVFGCSSVDEDGNICIDTKSCKILLDHIKLRSQGVKKYTTFHRAFDLCTDPVKSCAKLIELGFDCILTSGCEPTAPQGATKLRKLQELYGNDINIMAGSGINQDNLISIYDTTGLFFYHSSASKKFESRIATNCERVFPYGVAKWQTTDIYTVYKMSKILDDIESSHKS